jgi:hypothetical protein
LLVTLYYLENMKSMMKSKYVVMGTCRCIEFWYWAVSGETKTKVASILCTVCLYCNLYCTVFVRLFIFLTAAWKSKVINWFPWQNQVWHHLIDNYILLSLYILFDFFTTFSEATPSRKYIIFCKVISKWSTSIVSFFSFH